MKISKKEGVTEVKLEHNKFLFWVIIFLLILLIALLFVVKARTNNEKYLAQLNNSLNSSVIIPISCNSDSDCVPDSCCHAASCTLKNNAPNCLSTSCTLDCKPGTLDCGGSCLCNRGKCEANIRN